MTSVSSWPGWLGVVAGTLLSCSLAVAGQASFVVVDDSIDLPLGGLVGDVSRGKAIVANRQLGLCVMCHQLPIEIGIPLAFQGTIAPSIEGAGNRWTAAQLRLRMVDSRRLNPDSIMPAYHRTAGLSRVGAAWQGRPLLDAQQIEDVVAFLVTLK